MKVYLGTLPYRGECFNNEVWNFIEKHLIIACVFMYVFEIEGLLGDNLMDNPRSAYQVDMLKAFL